MSVFHFSFSFVKLIPRSKSEIGDQRERGSGDTQGTLDWSASYQLFLPEKRKMLLTLKYFPAKGYILYFKY